MDAKYSTSGTDTWIVDVMEDDSVMASAEADSEEEAMALARANASAFYGSRAAMFEYTVYPPPPGQEDGVGGHRRQYSVFRGLHSRRSHADRKRHLAGTE